MKARDRRFCDEYMIDMDAKNAAIRAGFAVSTARNASAWLGDGPDAKPEVIAEIDRRMAALSRRTGVNAARVLSALAEIAFARITDVADMASGKVLAEISPEDAGAIASIKIKPGECGTEREVKMLDRTRALELLGKHLGMFTDNIQVNGAVPVIIDGIEAADAE